MDPDTFLLHVPPAILETLFSIMDVGGDTLGWRELAVRILPTYLEVRKLDRVEAAGGSPSRELLWSWGQQSKTVRDLQRVLLEMGHLRALQLLQGPAQVSGLAPAPSTEVGSAGQTSAAEVKIEVMESFPLPEESCSSQLPYLTKCHAESQSPVISLQDVLEATRSFHPETRIAEGHFSNVYKAQIGHRTFAVKLFKQTNAMSWKKLWDGFTKEIEVHHMYQHPNILDLLDCFSDEHHYCLLYPYLPNGSLFGRLHQQGGERPLSWEERLAIIKGIAKAVHHLHTVQPCPVICGNISSQNILLDDTLQPRLSDFRLARLRPPADTRHCTITFNTRSHSNQGYLPEEYIRYSKLTFSLDIYCLGMVIMETVTGQKVTEDAPKKTRLRDLLSTEVEDSGCVETCLQFVDETAGRWPKAMALSLLSLALDCTASRPSNRPSMEDVLLALSQLLPPPRCPLTDQPHSLDDRVSAQAAQAPQSPYPSIPVEHDEQCGLFVTPALAGPCEYSQSEVTYLTDLMGAHSEAALDLYTCLPVPVAKAAEQACEDCRAQRATPHYAESRQYSSLVENEAKNRLRNKVSLYNKGLIHTEELLSKTGSLQ